MVEMTPSTLAHTCKLDGCKMRKNTERMKVTMKWTIQMPPTLRAVRTEGALGSGTPSTSASFPRGKKMRYSKTLCMASEKYA